MFRSIQKFILLNLDERGMIRNGGLEHRRSNNNINNAYNNNINNNPQLVDTNIQLHQQE